MSQLDNLDKKINLLNKRIELKNLLKKYNKKLEKINKKIKLKLLYEENEKKLICIDSQKSDVICEYEKPMPLIYNNITEKNLNIEKSYIQTKKLIHKMNKRKIKIKHEVVKDDILNIKPNFNEKETYISNDYNINIDGIIVKEEIEIPPFYYTDIPLLEHVY
jgi:hypothetical protein